MAVIATKPFKSNVSTPPEISDFEEKFSSRLLNKTEPFLFNGVEKTRFWTEIDTNIKKGDRVFILNGNYDSKNLLEENLFTKDSTGYTVLWADKTSLVLDLDWDDNISNVWLDEFEDYVKIKFSEDVDYEEKSGRFFPYNYDKDFVLYDGTEFKKSDSSNLDLTETLNFDQTIFNDFSPTNERIYIVNDFTLNLPSHNNHNHQFKSGEVYKWDNDDSKWKIDIKYQPSYISRSNFRNGTFLGSWNDGIFGSLENENIFESDSTWNSGVLINSIFNSRMQSKSDNINKTSFYSFIENDEIKTIQDNSNNRNFGYNFAWRSHFVESEIENGNILDSYIGDTYTGDNYINKYIAGASHSFFNHINRARVWNSTIENSEILDGEVAYSNNLNSNITARSLDSSYLYSRVSGEMRGGTIDITDYERFYWDYNFLNDPTVTQGESGDANILIHRFYISPEDWKNLSKLECCINFHNLVTNQDLEERVVNFFDTNFTFEILDYNEYNLDYNVVTRLNPNGDKLEIVNDTVQLSFDSRPCIDIVITDPDSYLEELEIKSVRNAKIQVGRFSKSQFEGGVWKANKINNNGNIIEKSGINLSISAIPNEITASINNSGNIEEDDLVFLDNIYGHNVGLSSPRLEMNGTYIVDNVSSNDIILNDYSQNNLSSVAFDTIFKNEWLTYQQFESFSSSHGLDIDQFLSIHTERIIDSKIERGFISRTLISNCEIENNEFELERDFSFENINILKFNEMILSDVNDLEINSGIFVRSFIFSRIAIFGSDIIEWNNGIIFNSLVKNIEFNNGIIKRSKWVDDNSSIATQNIFRNGLFIDGDKKVISDNNVDEFRWSFLDSGPTDKVLSEWQVGEFYNGEFSNSIWERGDFYGGNFLNSIWATGQFWDGTFGDPQLKNRDTRFTDPIWTKYVLDLGYSFNTAWNGGRFRKGRFGIRNPENFDPEELELIWNNGIFEDGVIVSFSKEDYPIIWKGGNFNNGLIEGYVLWESGNFNNGRFLSIWGDGFGSDGYAWKNGVWNGGIFGNNEGYIELQSNVTIKSENPSWEEGRFTGGDFYGRVWNSGIFTGGNFYGNPNNYSQNVEVREKFDENVGEIEFTGKITFGVNWILNGILNWRFLVFDGSTPGIENSIENSTFKYNVGSFDKTYPKFKSDYSYNLSRKYDSSDLNNFSSGKIESNPLSFNLTKIEIPFVHEYDISNGDWEFEWIVEIFKKDSDEIWDNSKALYRGDIQYDDKTFRIFKNEFTSSDANIQENILSIDFTKENIRDIDNNRIEKIDSGQQILIRISYRNLDSSSPTVVTNILRCSDIRLYSDDYSQRAVEDPDKFIMNFAANPYWYGMWRDGEVVIDDASTSDSKELIELTNKNRTKRQFKEEVSQRINFENALFIDGQWNAEGIFRNSLFLNGTFNKGRFIMSNFNPYVPRWDFNNIGGQKFLINGDFNWVEYNWIPWKFYYFDIIFHIRIITADTWEVIDNNLNFIAYENDSVDIIPNFSEFYNLQMINKGDWEFEIDIENISGVIGGNNSYVENVNLVIYDINNLDRIIIGDNPPSDSISPDFTTTGIHSWTASLPNNSILAIRVSGDFKTEPDNAGDILTIINNISVNQNNEGLYQYDLNDNALWLGGQLSDSNFNISKFEKGDIINSKLFGANVKDGVASNIEAENCIWENGVWKNGMWLGANFERLEIFEEGIIDFNIFGTQSQAFAYYSSPLFDSLITNSFRLDSNIAYINSLINDDNEYVNDLEAFDSSSVPPFPSEMLFTFNNNDYNLLPGLNNKRVDNTDLDSSELVIEEKSNNLFDSIVVYDNFYDNMLKSYSLNTDASSSDFENDIVILIGPPFSSSSNILEDSNGIDAKLGNGAFIKGVWENGVWNNGPRDKNPYNFYGNGTQSLSITEDDESIYQNDLILDDIVNRFESSPDIWQIELSGSDAIGITYFNVGDKISIGNIIGKTVNNVRKTLSDSYRIIDIDYNQIRLKIEIKVPFPLATIEKDSIDHKIYVTSRVWENGVFHNGRFEGVWNSGIFQGHPMITLMEDTQFISGRIDGGHFKSNIVSTINAEVGPSFSSSLIQNSRVLLNNDTGNTSNLNTFNTYLDVNWQDDFGEIIDQTYSAIWPISEGTFKITTSDILQSSTNIWLGTSTNNYNQDLNLGTKFTRYTDIINSPLGDIQPPERLEDRGWKFSIRPPSNASPLPLSQDQNVFTGANYNDNQLEYISASVSNTYQPIFGFENIELDGPYFPIDPSETPIMIFDDILVNVGNLYNGEEFRPDEDMNCNIDIFQNYRVTMEASGTINKTYPSDDFLAIQASVYVNNSRLTSWQSFDNLFEFPDEVTGSYVESLSASVSFSDLDFQESDKVEVRMKYVPNSLAIYSGSYLLKVEMLPSITSNSNLILERNVITGNPLNLMRINTTNSSDPNAEHNITHENIDNVTEKRYWEISYLVNSDSSNSFVFPNVSNNIDNNIKDIQFTSNNTISHYHWNFNRNSQLLSVENVENDGISDIKFIELDQIPFYKYYDDFNNIDDSVKEPFFSSIEDIDIIDSDNRFIR